MEEYKILHGNERKFDDFLLNAHQEFVLTKIGGSTADKAGFREYSFVS
jgi:hydroxymethylglutaryl-CoA synthase